MVFYGILLSMEDRYDLGGAAPQHTETEPAPEPAAEAFTPGSAAGMPAPQADTPDAPAADEAGGAPLPGLTDEEAELEEALDAALHAPADDDPDDGTDLAGAFAHTDKPRFDARMLLIPVLGVLAIGALVWALLARGNPEGKLVINEVMTSNQSTLTDGQLGTPDWVELYNGSGSDLNIAGFGMSDSMKNSYRYTLPDVTIPAGGYLLVYFVGGTEAADNNPLCAGFGLSKNGDQLVLVDAHYEVLSEVTVPALDADAAYARRADGSYAVTYVPTPNAANSVPED